MGQIDKSIWLGASGVLDKEQKQVCWQWATEEELLRRASDEKLGPCTFEKSLYHDGLPLEEFDYAPRTSEESGSHARQLLWKCDWNEEYASCWEIWIYK